MLLLLLLLCVLCRDFLTRIFKSRMGEKQKAQPDNVNDPLGEIYFQTLVWLV